MTAKPKCSMKTKAGEPCKNDALPGKAVCFAHDASTQTPESKRKGQAASVRAKHAKKLNANALRREVTEVRAFDIAAKLLCGVPLSSPDSARSYLGRRSVTHEGTIIGLHILLVLSGPHLAPSAAKLALEEALPPELRPRFMPPPEDIYRAARAEWRTASVQYTEAAGLFVTAYPPTCYAAWEDPVQVNIAEPIPTFEDWTVGPLGDSETHVLAVAPDGAEVIVPRALEEPLASA